MRSVKMTLGLAAALCALGAGSASALAHEFTASIVGKTISEATPAKTKTVGVGEQSFTFGAVKITCGKATGKGIVVAPASQTLKTTMRYSHCTTAIKVGPEPATLPTHFTAPIELNFHANGVVENGTEGEEGSVEIGSGTAELKVSGIKCIVDWPAQLIPLKSEKHPEGEYEAAVYSNHPVANEKLKKFPSGFQNKLVTADEFKGMEWEIEGETCENFKHTEGKSGKYVGTLETEINGGNLGWM